jgi:glycosyltransferase involved in cell wall biosynthesis
VTRRLLCLSTYPAADASVRQRFLAYTPAIEDAGWDIHFHSIMSERMFAIKNRTGALARIEQSGRMLAGLAGRICVLARCGHYDTIWLHREAFPILTPLAEAWVQHRCPGRVVLDFDDALHAAPPAGRDWRSPLRRPDAFADVVSKYANRVLAGSPLLADWAMRQGAAVEQIPTCVDTEIIRPAERSNALPVTIGWVGSWTTTKCLELVTETLRAIDGMPGVRFLFVGSPNLETVTRFLSHAEWRRWTQKTESCDLSEFDIGIMPLPDSEWNRGKCAYKLIQYAALGIPFVASPVGMNRDILRSADGAGIACETIQEWTRVLKQLVSDRDRRAQMGAAGRAYALEHFDWRLYAARVVDTLEEKGSTCRR